jgi:transcriptional regulator with XRE-family HTH domain
MQLAADFKRLRQARGLSKNQVSTYADVDRNTLTRLEEANILPRLEILERLARYIGADVNAWRTWAGHPRIPTYDGRAYLAERITELAQKHELANIPVEYLAGVEADTPPEVVDLRIERLDAELLRLRDEKVTKA